MSINRNNKRPLSPPSSPPRYSLSPSSSPPRYSLSPSSSPPRYSLSPSSSPPRYSLSPPRSPVRIADSLLSSLNRDFYDNVVPKCDPGGDIMNDFRPPLLELIRNGIIVPEEDKLNVTESVKESWETDLVVWPPISCDCLLSVKYMDLSDTERKKVEDYLESAKKNKYFEAPEKRPDGLLEGFYLIYPERQDTVFHIHPNFTKFTDFVSKLGPVAVETHNLITESKLRFSRMVKAYLFISIYNQYYFITLEALDESGNSIICKSRVVCGLSTDDTPNTEVGMEMDECPVSVLATLVQSFELVKVSAPR